MTERIDHAAEAQKHIEWAHEQQGEEGRFEETVQHNATLAVAEATLALVEQQRIANLIAVNRYRVNLASPMSNAPQWEIAPEVKEALGLS